MALRDAIEATKGLPVTHGVVNMSPTDHSGLGKDARVLITPENGAWKLVHLVFSQPGAWRKGKASPGLAFALRNSFLF